MSSSQQRVINGIRKIAKNRAIVATGIVTGIGFGIYYLDATNSERFEKKMVKNWIFCRICDCSKIVIF